MATVLIRNISKRDITINANNKSGEVVAVTIHPESIVPPVSGIAEVDAEFLAAAKKHPAVQGLFDDGSLEVVKQAKAAEKPAEKQPE